MRLRVVPVFLAIAALGAACRPTVDRGEAALIEAALLTMETPPTGYAPRLGPRWFKERSDSIPMLEALARRTGLPIATDAEITGRDSTIAVLAMDPPIFATPDSIIVLSAWVMLTSGDGGGGWGIDYETYLRCERRRCTVVSHEAVSRWN